MKPKHPEEYINKYGINEELAVIKFNTDKLTNDIVNLFDLVRYERGVDMYDHDQTTDFTLLLTNSLILFKSLAQHKQIHVAEYIESNVVLKASSEALSRMINNLVENAIKYTKIGGKIEVQLIRQGEEVVFSVTDSGIGIPAHLQDKIFEPYFQINNHKKNSQGLGMGLSIVKKIVDSLQGTILLESCHETGTTINIKLPDLLLARSKSIKEIHIPQQSRLQMSTPIPEDSIHDHDAPYILIVEDNLTMLNYLTNKLKDKYNIYVAENGVKALEKLETVQQLDLILSDVMMDAVDGFQLYQIVMEKRAFSHVPFLFLTAKTTSKDKLQGLSLGAMDYIEKPFSINALMHKIDAILANLAKQREVLIKQAYRSIFNKPTTVDQVSGDTRTFETNCKKFNLTRREIEIVRLVTQGQTYQSIADTLHISNKTVAKHVQNIFSKSMFKFWK